MNKVEYTVTAFAKHIGTTKQHIYKLIANNQFSYQGYKLVVSDKRTKILKVDRQFLFSNKNPIVVLIIKSESPELATLSANDVLFNERLLSFRFKVEDAKEIEENYDLISYIPNEL